MKWDLVCFDLDNTLFDYEKTFQQTMEHCFETIIQKKDYFIRSEDWFKVFKKYCDRDWIYYETMEWSKQEYKRTRYLDTMSELNLVATEEDADLLQCLFNKNVHKFVVPYKGMPSLLASLQTELHGKLAIITNGMSEVQRLKIQSLQLDSYFPEHSIIISDEIGCGKPDKKIFLFAKNKLAPDSTRCLYIGDSWELDVLGAKAANWEAIYFNTRDIDPPEIDTSIPIIHSIKEMHSFLFTDKSKS